MIMKKIITFAIIITMISTVWAAAHTISEDKALHNEWENTREVITVRVQYGDTLDGFGYEYKPEWMDVREYREQVKDLNDMTSSMLYAGQTIKLYVEGAE